MYVSQCEVRVVCVSPSAIVLNRIHYQCLKRMFTSDSPAAVFFSIEIAGSFHYYSSRPVVVSHYYVLRCS